MEENKETIIEQGLVCEDVITSDRVAMEMIKAIMRQSLSKDRTLWNRIKSALGIEKPYYLHSVPYAEDMVRLAYQYADAFIEEMERRKQHE